MPRMQKQAKSISKSERVTRICMVCKGLLADYEPVMADFWRLSKSTRDGEFLVPSVLKMAEMIRDLKILMRKGQIIFSTHGEKSMSLVEDFIQLKTKYESKWLSAEKGMVGILDWVETHL